VSEAGLLQTFRQEASAEIITPIRPTALKRKDSNPLLKKHPIERYTLTSPSKNGEELPSIQLKSPYLDQEAKKKERADYDYYQSTSQQPGWKLSLK